MSNYQTAQDLVSFPHFDELQDFLRGPRSGTFENFELELGKRIGVCTTVAEREAAQERRPSRKR
jgi:hypothetical protein